jgi:hypothetical protein
MPIDALVLPPALPSPRLGVTKANTMLYRASKFDCGACALKSKCCPNTPARKVPRSIHEGARDMARDIAKTDAYVVSRRERKKVEMLYDGPIGKRTDKARFPLSFDLLISPRALSLARKTK